MNTLFSQVLSIVLRVLVLAASLVAAVSIAAVATLLGSVLLLRSGWKKLSFKAMNLRNGRRADRGTKSPDTRRGAAMSRMPRGEVTDVVARAPSRS